MRVPDEQSSTHTYNLRVDGSGRDHDREQATDAAFEFESVSASESESEPESEANSERDSDDDSESENATATDYTTTARTTQSANTDCPDSLIVVSNRQPYRHTYDDERSVGDGPTTETEDDHGTDTTETSETAGSPAPSISVDEPTGGLTAGIDPVLQEANGTWIAWGDGDADFDVTDERDCVRVPPDDEAYTLRRIDLSEEAVDAYYRGFSNRVLWPLCHGFAELVEERSDDLEWYRTVNERFAAAVADHASEESVVWLQDYHFALAPRMIRQAIPDSASIAQFWHIPWPSPTTFDYCPAGEELLEGLLGNDLLGFHVERYANAFLDCVRRFLPDATVDHERGTVQHNGQTTRVVATAMGVDAESYDQQARETDAAQLLSLFDRYDIPRNSAIGLGVDRLDYTKGIPERLTALERFFVENPSWHGDFTFIQKATPSRTEIPAYARHGDLVRSEVDRINRRFGTDDWQPIVYTEEYVEHDDLCALYRHADVMIVSPLIDGMNLVAQEYVAACVDTDGVLLLSDRAGAHERLSSHAVSIDPTDVSGFATAIDDALSMAPQERTARMNALRSSVFDGDIDDWMATQFDLLRRVHDGPGAGVESRERPSPL
ncbi:alpha,alpha-trehalose-phosphate synthase (UDP-forming) [Natrialba sp. SSL1]|uniref:alpha,alpha-trehalose-phosphate synthase (UDP-forming) n=1 Tax=Natrialba sp. SSL1 TaxID=1869245 RepID=UPI0008F89B6C|nr:trehalose-6-phosphate synthase [Natrialba sp. SSL1]OIB57146.1 trehalose-6-phosphate synthase [Natrialba sp. SSL1]